MITDDMIATFRTAAFNRQMHEDGCPEGEAIRAGLEAVEGMFLAAQWQPIETAPRDGTVFLAYQSMREHRCYECWWQDDFSNWSGWQDWWDSEPSPTHWMPLLAAPTGDA